jgi:hypothetical protein
VTKIIETTAGLTHGGEDIHVGLSGLEGRNAGSRGDEWSDDRKNRGGAGFGVFRGDDGVGEESYEAEL